MKPRAQWNLLSRISLSRTRKMTAITQRADDKSFYNSHELYMHLLCNRSNRAPLFLFVESSVDFGRQNYHMSAREKANFPFLFNNSFWGRTGNKTKQKLWGDWMMRSWWPTRSRCVNVKETAAFQCSVGRIKEHGRRITCRLPHGIHPLHSDRKKVEEERKTIRRRRRRKKKWAGFRDPSVLEKKHVAADNTPCPSWEKRKKKKQNNTKGERLNPHDSFFLCRPSPNKK